MVLEVDPANLNVIRVRSVDPSPRNDVAFSIGFCQENGVVRVAGGVNIRTEEVGEVVSERGWVND